MANWLNHGDLLRILELPKKPVQDFKVGDVMVDTEPSPIAFVVEVSKPGDEPTHWCILDAFGSGGDYFLGGLFGFIPKEWIDQKALEFVRSLWAAEMRGGT